VSDAPAGIQGVLRNEYTVVPSGNVRRVSLSSLTIRSIIEPMRSSAVA
jgi:hypothetical protein